MIDFSFGIDRKQPHRPSEILPLLLGRHKKFLMGHMGWWRTLGLEAELEMADDPDHHRKGTSEDQFLRPCGSSRLSL